MKRKKIFQQENVNIVKEMLINISNYTKNYLTHSISGYTNHLPYTFLHTNGIIAIHWEIKYFYS